MKIMVFLHGTAIMHKSGLGKTPDERGKQVEENEESVHRYDDYVPVGNADRKLRMWVQQEAEIVYLSSHQNEEDIRKDIKVLSTYNFPDAPVLYRHGKETYAEIAERVMPDVLIEDNCESIGGESEMTFPHINPQKKKLIKSIVVNEFSGIDDLPDDINQLKKFI